LGDVVGVGTFHLPEHFVEGVDEDLAVDRDPVRWLIVGLSVAAGAERR
jgi:hypothetical protein